MLIAIQHAEFDDRRGPSLSRLLQQIEGRGRVNVIASRRREHPSVFGTRLWEYVEACGGPVICLEDDVQVPRGFEAACEAAFEAGGGESLSLHLQAPGLRDVAATGARWARCYWLSTVACILTPKDARDLLDFAASLPWTFRSQVAHDNVAIHFAWARQRPWLATIPCLATHDGVLPSTLGYDAHPNRGPAVAIDADEAAPLDWPSSLGAAFTVNPWASAGWMTTIRDSLRSEGGVCAACMVRPAAIGSAHAALCRPCVMSFVGTAMGVNTQVATLSVPAT